MNRRRIAALLRELADEFEAEERPANDAPRARRYRPTVLPGPLKPPSDTDRAAALAASRRLGHLVKRGT